jgi:chromosome segregation ATPase
MSYISCPLCGRLCHLSSFNPESYDLDIEVVEMQSQGRGKGFEVLKRYSALDDVELMSRISRRLKELLALIEGEADDPEEEKQKLLDTIEELNDDVRALKLQLRQEREKLRQCEEIMAEEKDTSEELLDLVNDALGDVYETEFDDLDSAVRALVDEYLDTLEEAEDLD